MGNILALKTMITGKSSTISKSTKKKDIKNKSTQKSGTITFRRSFDASRTMAQLANATTKAQVDAIERTVRAQMQSMKKQSNSEEAVKQMKKVIQKANMKHKALSKEEQLDNTRKIAKIAKNKKEEAKLIDELTKKRRNRMSREQADALNSVEVQDMTQTNHYSNNEQNEQQTTSIDVACDSFEVSTGISGAECGISIDTLL